MTALSDSPEISSSGNPEPLPMAHLLPDDVLLVEKDDVDATATARLLAQLPGHRNRTVRRAGRLSDALRSIDEQAPAVILADLSLPDASGEETVRALLEAAPLAPVIISTGLRDDEAAARALQLGAQDYLIKGEYTRGQLGRALRYAVQRQKLLSRRAEPGARSRGESELAILLAHDLRSPIRTVRMLLDLVLRDDGAARPERVAAARGQAERALARIDSLICSIIDYESVRSEAPTLRRVAVGEVAADAVELVSSELQEANGRCHVALRPDLTAWADGDLLVRVFVNLLANSIRYRQSDVPLLIEIAGTERNGTIVIEVVDNGRGIPVGARERIFDGEIKLETAAASGLGIGLTVCRRIIESCGGEIEVRPTGGPGTTIAFTLDAAAPAADDGVDGPEGTDGLDGDDAQASGRMGITSEV